MSGHSKWSTIKHKKAVNDAKRSNIFTKLAKNITIATRDGGGSDPEMNFRLRMAIDKARSLNMPKDNIERAIKRGTGELKEGQQIEEIVYEAYGPGQVAMLIKVVTDNKNRTHSEVKNIVNKNGGKMVEGGSVSWQFENLGVLEVVRENKDPEELELLIIDSGAKDYREDEGKYIVFTIPHDLQKIRNALGNESVKILEASLSYIAKETIELAEEARSAYERLYDSLDEHDDVAEIFDNIR